MRTYVALVTLVFSSCMTYILKQRSAMTRQLPLWRNPQPLSVDARHQHDNQLLKTEPARSSYNAAITFGGRLGNHLFQYSALVAIAAANNLTAQIAPDCSLPAIFNLQDRPHQPGEDVLKNYTKYHHRFGAMTYDNGTADLARQLHGRQNVRLEGFYQSWKYFEKIEQSLRKEFTFKPDIHRRALEHMEQKALGIWKDSAVKIGVHCRRGDFTYNGSQAAGRSVPPKEYFFKAMAYMKGKYHRVRFIVASDDIQWAKAAFGDDSVVYSCGLSAAEDLALLAQCQHVIISSGTYGWWAGWLANGSVVYYDLYPRPHSLLARGFTKEDYYPPHWVPMR